MSTVANKLASVKSAKGDALLQYIDLAERQGLTAHGKLKAQEARRAANRGNFAYAEQLVRELSREVRRG